MGVGCPAVPLDLKGPRRFIPGLLSQSFWLKATLGALRLIHQLPCPARPSSLLQLCGCLCRPIPPPPRWWQRPCFTFPGCPCLERPAPSSPCPAFPQGAVGPLDILTECVLSNPIKVPPGKLLGEPAVSYSHLGPNFRSPSDPWVQRDCSWGSHSLFSSPLLAWAPSENKDLWV